MHDPSRHTGACGDGPVGHAMLRTSERPCPGQVRKAAFVVGGGGGSGTLIYRGRHYRFIVSGFSLGLSAGASVTWLEGTASGIREVNDFAGSYTLVGGGGAWAAGVGGVSMRNERGVLLTLKGPKAGLEFAANLGGLTIALR